MLIGLYPIETHVNHGPHRARAGVKAIDRRTLGLLKYLQGGFSSNSPYIFALKNKLGGDEGGGGVKKGEKHENRPKNVFFTPPLPPHPPQFLLKGKNIRRV